jgi:hypothetical protein
MTNMQFYILMAVPLLGVLLNGLVFQALNSRMTDLRVSINDRFASLEKIMDARFEAANQSLMRVEGVIDARLSSLDERLKHLEPR